MIFLDGGHGCYIAKDPLHTFLFPDMGEEIVNFDWNSSAKFWNYSRNTVSSQSFVVFQLAYSLSNMLVIVDIYLNGGENRPSI